MDFKFEIGEAVKICPSNIPYGSITGYIQSRKEKNNRAYYEIGKCCYQEQEIEKVSNPF